MTNPDTLIDFTVFQFANKEPFEDIGYGPGNEGAGNGVFDWDDVDADGQHDAGETSEPFTDTGLDPTRPGWQTSDFGYGDGIYNMGNPVEEDVGGYLIRAVAWVMDHTHVDGLRLDAVKHVPDYFFGEFNDDVSDAGYLGAVQRQYNVTRGYSDWDNHRDTLFDHRLPRDDAMAFGEHLGEPPGFGGYVAAGMRLVDNDLRSKLNSNLGNPFAGLQGLDGAGAGGFSPFVSVSHAQSHDNDFASMKQLQHAFYFTRHNIPLVYTDGNYQSETLGESGGAFPRHANTAFLGQFGDNRLPNVVYLHNHFARGDQWGRRADADVVAYDRVDKHENPGMADSDGAVLSFMMNDNGADGQYRDIPTTFPEGAYLWNYADRFGRNDNGFYHTVQNGTISVIIPSGGYFAFSWRSPEESTLWSGFGGDPVTIYDNGEPASFVSYERRDGPDGDPGFNPYGVADSDPEDFAYDWFVPRITEGTNVRFVARVDGSANNVLMKLNGGIDLNGANHPGGDPRDNPPALSRDFVLGYEQANYVHRQHPERFAAQATGVRDILGSAGAETYEVLIGTGIVTNYAGSGTHAALSIAPDFVYHDPGDVTDTAAPQLNPPPASAANTSVTNWIKIGDPCDANSVWVYYTTDGSFPEGAGGVGHASTQVLTAEFDHSDSGDGFDWWKAVFPPQPDGTQLRYKIGAAAVQGGACSIAFDVPFPSNQGQVDKKKQMMGVWDISGFNFQTASYRPHNDYSKTETGLPDGFHMIQARAFLDRANRASIYNTFPQTFYLDTEVPQGEIKFPGSGDTIGNEYGVVVRTDRTVSDVLYNIDDSDPSNDDANTGLANGNGTNTLGEVVWLPASKVQPTLAIDSEYPEEWRFTYNNIPSSGAANIRARLVEVSSSTNMSLGDVVGHYNTLTQMVNAASDPITMTIAFPANDGETVGPDYVLKVLFSEVLDTSGFVFSINGVVQGSDQFVFNNIGGGLRELAIDLPNLYNGDPNFQHTLAIRHTPPGGGVTRQSTRSVRAFPADDGPMVQIIEPREFDSDGQPLDIILPDKPPAELDEDDRRTPIEVETDLDAEYVWIVFNTNEFNVGSAELDGTVETMLSGEVSVTSGSTRVDGLDVLLSGSVNTTSGSSRVYGSGTSFSNEVRVGQAVRIESDRFVVTQIVSGLTMDLSQPFTNSSTNVSAFIPAAFTSELAVNDTIRIDTNILTVASVQSDNRFTLATGYPGPTSSGESMYRLGDNPSRVGSSLFWTFDWTNLTAGTYRFTAFVNTNDTSRTFIHGSDDRTIDVILRDLVEDNTNSLDDDMDGILDDEEQNTFNLPPTNPETWTNRDVKAWAQFGRSDYLLPDTDGDGLPDALEIGMRLLDINTNITDTAADTNGDGTPNFISDEDPPFYNTVPDNWNIPDYNFQGSRTELLQGTTTDPLNPDSDYDGLPDGLEDRNKNGWVDGDGGPLPGFFLDPNARSAWPDGEFSPGDGWTETDPNNSDTDGDGLQDGYGEDKDLNGLIAGDTNSNRVYELTEQWSETDPLNRDTDGDGLPDGWEVNFNFDPLDNGTNSFRDASSSTNGLIVNGADGNPDNDFIIVGTNNVAYTNIREFQNGTNPRFADDGAPPPDDSIIIGPGDPIGELNGMPIYQEFTDWTADDCLVLDEYEGDGNNNRQGDIYLGYDGFDTSRDITAFYYRDGGSSVLGGDDLFYFRLDFFDLQPLAEEANLDIYIVIDTGSPSEGERLLPDEVDTLTDMRWEFVVAAYASNVGSLYVDTDLINNTSDFGGDLFGFGGVQINGGAFISSYYNSELDSVELAIDRNAMTAAGWNGLDASQLNFQVYVTRDGTQNSPQGAGDIGGRSDIRDSIYDDFIAEDNFFSQGGIEPILTSWIQGSLSCGSAKLSSIVHGNQALSPGSEIQNKINDGAGAGYHRALTPHELFGKPLNLHVSAALASAIEWAAVDPAFGTPWRDGPSFNDRITDLIDTNAVYLMASTFADHAMPYYTPAYNLSNEQLARTVLENIYNTTFDPSKAVFWTPERLLDGDVFTKISTMGYNWTVLDQQEHLWDWLGREAALGNDGYRINQFHGVNTFSIINTANGFRFNNHDKGASLSLRRLFGRKARSGTQDQVIVLMSNWDDFGSDSNADAYDTNIRWVANRPWIQVVALEQIANGEVDVTGDGIGDNWFQIDRGSPTLNKVSHDFIQHASRENYDNWYVGSGQEEEGLEPKTFDIRTGVPVPDIYGMLYSGGVVSQAWDGVASIVDPNIDLLGRAAMHATSFQSAFHNEDNNNLSKFSTGDYIYPDTSDDTLADFAAHAQAMTRQADLFRRLDDWATALPAGVQTSVEDVDLDGEDEYLLYNQRLFAAFERIGGRMIGTWLRGRLSGEYYQVIGNPVSFAGRETEEEGAQNVLTNGAVVARRTSGLKDWFASYDGGTSQYVNDLYTVSVLSNGLTFVSSDTRVSKTVLLGDDARRLDVSYDINPTETLYVRHGLSPNLWDLVLNGQAHLRWNETAEHVELVNTAYVDTVTARVEFGGGYNSSYVSGAVDDDPGQNVEFFTLNMRNQAQTHQVEISGTDNFSFALSFDVVPSDWDGDGVPNVVEDGMAFLDAENGADGGDDEDGDGFTNAEEYIANTAMNNPADYPGLANAGMNATGIVVEVDTRSDRLYDLFYTDSDLVNPNWMPVSNQTFLGTGGIVEWIDDGSQTSPSPTDPAVIHRFYKSEVRLPE